MTNRSSRAPKSHSESWPRRRTRSEAYRAAVGSPATHSGYTLNAWVKAEKDRGQKNNNDVTAQPAWTGGGPDVGSPRGCTAGFVSSSGEISSGAGESVTSVILHGRMWCRTVPRRVERTLRRD